MAIVRIHWVLSIDLVGVVGIHFMMSIFGHLLNFSYAPQKLLDGFESKLADSFGCEDLSMEFVVQIQACYPVNCAVVAGQVYARHAHTYLATV